MVLPGVRTAPRLSGRVLPPLPKPPVDGVLLVFPLPPGPGTVGFGPALVLEPSLPGMLDMAGSVLLGSGVRLGPAAWASTG
jgi:hypothetical protein